MSDAMTETYQGTYFKDRSTTKTPKDKRINLHHSNKTFKNKKKLPKTKWINFIKIIKKVGNNVDFFNIYNN